jgi:hypothetical protein
MEDRDTNTASQILNAQPLVERACSVGMCFESNIDSRGSRRRRDLTLNRHAFP